MVVDRYVAALREAIGDAEQFAQLMVRLEADPEVKVAEAAAIATLFYGRTAASTAKKESVRRIWARHHTRMDYEAKALAQAGKSAA